VFLCRADHNVRKYCEIIPRTECNGSTIQKLPLGVNTAIERNNMNLNPTIPAHTLFEIYPLDVIIVGCSYIY
jgi:hypothetical protein